MSNTVKKVMYAAVSVTVSVFLGAILDQIMPVATSAVIMGAFILLKPSKWD